MRNSRNIPVCLAALALLSAAPLLAASLTEQRSAYLAAREALRQGRPDEYHRLLADLDGYPLKPYLQAEAIRRRLDRATAAEVVALLDAYPRLPPVERVRRLWFKRLANEHRYTELVAQYRPQADAALRCSHLHARLRLGLAAPFVPELWLAGHSRPRECDPLFAHFKAEGVINLELYWQRASLAVRSGNGRLAAYLARRLDPGRRAAIDRWLRLAVNPEDELLRARHWPDTAANREMLHVTLKGMARRRNDRARHHWQALRDGYAWSEATRADLEHDLALYYATDYPADALAALNAIPAPGVGPQILEWRVRVALKVGDWAAVLKSLEQLPEELAGRPRWRYWRARALGSLHRDAEATAIYRELARAANYYGFLSAERVGADYALCPQEPGPDEATLARLRELPAMRRAIELYHLGELHDARREWNLASEGLDREERRQAALLAADEGWVDRAVLTLADTGHQRIYRLRFPLSWESQVIAAARGQRLNPSLVYGVIRSESAMVTDAFSPAAAMGLMQLTAPTARRLARARGWRAPSRTQLYQPDFNIALGSAYLGELFERFQHPLPVLAAYNAGPDAVDRWRALSLPVEADRWIETVPYFETRDYLARVIAFATIYDWRREGKMVPLKLRMPPLDLRPGRTDLGVSGSLAPRCPRP